MAKKLVTENDLLSGVGGGFGNIAQMGTGRPIRDNPFRDTRSETAPPLSAPSATTGHNADAPQVVGNTAPQAQPVIAPRVAAQPIREAPAATPTTPRATSRTRVPRKATKTETYSEKMSTFLLPEMRDELEIVARRLNRNRLLKG